MRRNEMAGLTRCLAGRGFLVICTACKPLILLAERGGFEPPVAFLTLRRFSKPLLSTTQPPLRLLILLDFFHLHRLSLTVFASSCDDCHYFVTLLQLRHSPHLSLGVRMSIAQRGP